MIKLMHLALLASLPLHAMEQNKSEKNEKEKEERVEERGKDGNVALLGAALILAQHKRVGLEPLILDLVYGVLATDPGVFENTDHTIDALYNGKSLLYQAVQDLKGSACSAQITQLLKAGADPLAPVEGQKAPSPLHLSILRGKDMILERFLDSESAKNVLKSKGNEKTEPLLYYAVRVLGEQYYQQMGEKLKDVAKRNSYCLGYQPTIRHLAEIKSKDKDKEWARQAGTLSMLLTYYLKLHDETQKKSLLALTAERGFWPGAKKLLDYGVKEGQIAPIEIAALQLKKIHQNNSGAYANSDGSLSLAPLYHEYIAEIATYKPEK